MLLIKLKESPICRQIELKHIIFVGKLGLCALPTIFFSVAPAYAFVHRGVLVVKDASRPSVFEVGWPAGLFLTCSSTQNLRF